MKVLSTALQTLLFSEGTCKGGGWRNGEKCPGKGSTHDPSMSRMEDLLPSGSEEGILKRRMRRPAAEESIIYQ